VSRKKLKGKARKKAAKTEAAAAGERDLALSLPTQIRRPRECTHGWDVTEYPVDHDCHKFIEEVVRIFDECNNVPEGTVGLAVDKALSFTRDIFPDVWNNSACLEWISSAFVTLGTDAIINKAFFLCAAAMGFSEHLNQYGTESPYTSILDCGTQKPFIQFKRKAFLAWMVALMRVLPGRK